MIRRDAKYSAIDFIKFHSENTHLHAVSSIMGLCFSAGGIMKRLMISSVIVATVYAFIGVMTEAESSTPKTVLDYYMLLPQQYFEIPKADRKSLINRQGG